MIESESVVQIIKDNHEMSSYTIFNLDTSSLTEMKLLGVLKRVKQEGYGRAFYRLKILYGNIKFTNYLVDFTNGDSIRVYDNKYFTISYNEPKDIMKVIKK